MKIKLKGVFDLLCPVLIVLFSCSKHDDFPRLKGPYLGQKPPGMTPEVFAADVITEAAHSVAVFSPDGSEVFYISWPTLRMETMKQIDGVWTKPSVVSFASEYNAENPWLTTDGARMYFTSTRPLKIKGVEKFWQENIWFVDRQGSGWSDPVPIDSVVNSLDLHWQISINDRNHDLYFSAASGKTGAGSDIYKSVYVDGRYTSPDKLGGTINTDGDEDTPFIASDGSYLIFARKPGADTFSDLYISFRNTDGSWREAVGLNSAVNSVAHEVYPFVTRDGRYLFFISTRSGTPRVYWVDANIIERSRRR